MDINEEQLRILNNILNIFEIEKFDPAKGHIERVSMQDDLFIFSGIDVSDKDVRKLVVNYDFLDDKGSLLEKTNQLLVTNLVFAKRSKSSKSSPITSDSEPADGIAAVVPSYTLLIVPVKVTSLWVILLFKTVAPVSDSE